MSARTGKMKTLLKGNNAMNTIHLPFNEFNKTFPYVILGTKDKVSIDDIIRFIYNDDGELRRAKVKQIGVSKKGIPYIKAFRIKSGGSDRHYRTYRLNQIKLVR